MTTKSKIIGKDIPVDINTITAFPDGITEIRCNKSISDLSILNGRIPNTVKKVIIADEVLDAAKQNIQTAAKALLFQSMYPNIVIIGNKSGKTLQETLATKPAKTDFDLAVPENPFLTHDIEYHIEIKETTKTNEKVEQTDVVPVIDEPKEPSFPTKTSAQCDFEDIMIVCKNDDVIKSTGLLDCEIEKVVKKHMRRFNKALFFNQETNSVVLCISQAHVDTLLLKARKEIRQILSKRLNNKAKEAKNEQPAPENNITKTPAQEPVVIEKAIVIEPQVIRNTDAQESVDNKIQTEDYYNIKDILAICIADPEIQSFNQDESVLEKEIRKQMKTFDRHFRFNPQTNSDVACISRSNIEKLIEKVKKSLQKMEYKKTKTQTTTESINMAKTQKTNKHLESRTDISLVPVVIKKYIPKKLWKDICRACGKHLDMQKSVLENIASVNTNLNETPSSTHIQIINPETGKRTSSSYLKREEVGCIIQSITDSLRKDNKRIVWAYLHEEKILVCTGVYTEHTKTKAGNSYSKTRDWASIGLDANGKEITSQRIIDEEYMDVDDMLKQYIEVINQMEAPEATRSGTNTVEPDKKVKKVIETEEVKGPASAQVEEAKPAAKASVSATPTAEQIVQIEKTSDLTDVVAAQTKINAVIDLINKTVKQNLAEILEEKDTAKQIEKIDLVRDALIQKAKIELLLPEIEKTNDVLKKLQMSSAVKTK